MAIGNDMIAIIDYGMGNLRSVQKAFERVGACAQIVSQPDQIARAEKVVLPGVGAFRDAIAHLRSQHLVDPVRDAVRSGRPFLGICLGLQLLFDISYEDGEYPGLGILPGKVVRFDFSSLPGAAELKIPQMGWNQLQWTADCPVLRGIAPGTHFYFVHSYHVVPSEPGSVNPVSEPGSVNPISEPGSVNAISEPGSVNPVFSARPDSRAAERRATRDFPGSQSPALRDVPGSQSPALNVATCCYGYDFAAMVWRDNLFATQFHPEKSQSAGLQLLENFTRL